MIAIMSQPHGTESERLLSVIREMLVDIRAQIYASHPDLAELLRASEHLVDAVNRPEERREMIELLHDFERKHLGGRPRYSSLLGSGTETKAQLRWDW